MQSLFFWEAPDLVAPLQMIVFHLCMKTVFNDCEIDTDAGVFRRNGEVVRLEPQVFNLLALFVRNPSRLIDHDTIIAEVWNGRIVSDATISSRINAVRRAIGDDGRRQSILQTVPRRGFRFAEFSIEAEPQDVRSLESAGALRGPLIAVLPFRNLSVDPADRFFAEGVAEDIMTELSRFGSLRVMSRITTFRLDASSPEVLQRAAELEADFVLAGSVRRASGRIRISVELAEAATERPVWTERYDRPIDDVFSVQDEIAEVVASTLSGQIQKIALDRARMKRTESLSAYENLLRGLDLHKGGFVSAQTAEQAVAFFSAAIDEDPGFARAYAWRACSRSRTWSYPAKKTEFQACLEDVETALRLDPTEAEAHRILAAVLRLDRQFDRADFHAFQAATLNPSDAFTMIKVAEHEAFMGRVGRARFLYEKALSLTPIVPDPFWDTAALIDYVDMKFTDVLAHTGKPSKPSLASYGFRAAAAVELGKTELATQAVAALEKDFPGATLVLFRPEGYRFSFADSGMQERLMASLGAAGLKDDPRS